jgi:shikimate dehydrogenase
VLCSPGLVAYNAQVSEPSAPPINARTRYCAVYGFPVRHSASPAMQNAGIGALALNWRYLAFEVHPDHLPAAIEGAKVMGFIGLNLTVPHKLLAAGLVDALDESARTWGAVNTIRFEGRDPSGIWRPLGAMDEAPEDVRSHGFNTDAEALTRALREDLRCEPAGARVLILGAGGAGRTAALKLAAEKPAELFLVNRTLSKARVVQQEIVQRHPEVKVTVGYPTGPVDLLLNATSLGLQANDPLPLDDTQFSLRQAGAVYDMIYRPAETPLLARAKAAGCRAANGLGMLLYQGARALELWTGQAAPVALMRHALKQEVYG